MGDYFNLTDSLTGLRLKSMPKSQKGIAFIPIIIGSVIVLLIGIIAAAAPQTQKSAKDQSGQESNASPSPTSSPIPTPTPSQTPSPTMTPTLAPSATPTPKSTSTPIPTPKPSVTSSTTQDSSGGFVCSGKTTCGQMTSCAEAKFYLNSCGLKSLDRDNDGIPCETTHCK